MDAVAENQRLVPYKFNVDAVASLRILQVVNGSRELGSEGMLGCIT